MNFKLCFPYIKTKQLRVVKKKETQNQSTEASKSDIGWGHQIRSYVLQPYRLVKDNRTNFESTNPDKVLNGEIDNFFEFNSTGSPS